MIRRVAFLHSNSGYCSTVFFSIFTQETESISKKYALAAENTMIFLAYLKFFHILQKPMQLENELMRSSFYWMLQSNLLSWKNIRELISFRNPKNHSLWAFQKSTYEALTWKSSKAGWGQVLLVTDPSKFSISAANEANKIHGWFLIIKVCTGARYKRVTSRTYCALCQGATGFSQPLSNISSFISLLVMLTNIDDLSGCFEHKSSISSWFPFLKY